MNSYLWWALGLIVVAAVLAVVLIRRGKKTTAPTTAATAAPPQGTAPEALGNVVSAAMAAHARALEQSVVKHITDWGTAIRTDIASAKPALQVPIVDAPPKAPAPPAASVAVPSPPVAPAMAPSAGDGGTPHPDSIQGLPRPQSGSGQGPTTLADRYPTAQAIQSAADAIGFSNQITVDGELIHQGFGPPLPFYKQADGTYATTRPAASVSTAPPVPTAPTAAVSAPPAAPQPAPAPSPAGGRIIETAFQWGAPGSGNCRGHTADLGGFRDRDVVVVSFTTPPRESNGQLGALQAAESNSVAVSRTAALSTRPGAFDNTLGVHGGFFAIAGSALVSGNTVSITFQIGGTSQQHVVLQPSTTYYFNVKNTAGVGGDMVIDLVKPPGL